MITQYDAEIFKLKERIDTMSSDFAKMLKTTLRKMQERIDDCLLYTSPSPRDATLSRMPSSA